MEGAEEGTPPAGAELAGMKLSALKKQAKQGGEQNKLEERWPYRRAVRLVWDTSATSLLAVCDMAEESRPTTMSTSAAHYTLFGLLCSSGIPKMAVQIVTEL